MLRNFFILLLFIIVSWFSKGFHVFCKRVSRNRSNVVSSYRYFIQDPRQEKTQLRVIVFLDTLIIMWLQLANKTAIVTGAGSGIGAACECVCV